MALFHGISLPILVLFMARVSGLTCLQLVLVTIQSFNLFDVFLRPYHLFFCSYFACNLHLAMLRHVILLWLLRH